LSPAELDTHWGELAEADAARAYRAVWDLAAAPEALPFLKQRLAPVPAPDARRLQKALADLDSESFARRQQAMREGEKAADLAGPALRKLLESRVTLETRQRVQQLLAKVATPSGEQLRQLRALEALEHAGTPEARRVLEAAARGAPEARLTREAQATLR